MLSTEEKIKYFEKYLEESSTRYPQSEIYEYFFMDFDLNDEFNKVRFGFLNDEETPQDIEKKVEFLVSKIVLHDHEDSIENIIQNYSH